MGRYYKRHFKATTGFLVTGIHVREFNQTRLPLWYIIECYCIDDCRINELPASPQWVLVSQPVYLLILTFSDKLETSYCGWQQYANVVPTEEAGSPVTLVLAYMTFQS